jgi:hypothetical protein
MKKKMKPNFYEIEEKNIIQKRLKELDPNLPGQQVKYVT